MKFTHTLQRQSDVQMGRSERTTANPQRLLVQFRGLGIFRAAFVGGGDGRKVGQMIEGGGVEGGEVGGVATAAFSPARAAAARVASSASAGAGTAARPLGRARAPTAPVDGCQRGRSAAVASVVAAIVVVFEVQFGGVGGTSHRVPPGFVDLPQMKHRHGHVRMAVPQRPPLKLKGPYETSRRRSQFSRGHLDKSDVVYGGSDVAMMFAEGGTGDGEGGVVRVHCLGVVARVTVDLSDVVERNSEVDPGASMDGRRARITLSSFVGVAAQIVVDAAVAGFSKVVEVSRSAERSLVDGHGFLVVPQRRGVASRLLVAHSHGVESLRHVQQERPVRDGRRSGQGRKLPSVFAVQFFVDPTMMSSIAAVWGVRVEVRPVARAPPFHLGQSGLLRR
mmetsp:Transcript_14567/g.42691  ORF Transcript_14567/g.42691 Transcript_14567/m.42691 type:complete len:392 (+) Transcript_14567:343-1518(+)